MTILCFFSSKTMAAAACCYYLFWVLSKGSWFGWRMLSMYSEGMPLASPSLEVSSSDSLSQSDDCVIPLALSLRICFITWLFTLIFTGVLFSINELYTSLLTVELILLLGRLNSFLMFKFSFLSFTPWVWPGWPFVLSFAGSIPCFFIFNLGSCFIGDILSFPFSASNVTKPLTGYSGIFASRRNSWLYEINWVFSNLLKSCSL